MILIYNITITFIRLSRKARFETLFEYKQNDAFLITSVNASFIIENVKSWKFNLAKDIMIITSIFIEITQKPMSEITVFKIIVFMIKTFLIQIDLNLEHIIFNDIIVYNTSKVVIQIVFVTDKFSEIWKDQNVIVNILEKKMNVYISQIRRYT